MSADANKPQGRTPLDGFAHDRLAARSLADHRQRCHTLGELHFLARHNAIVANAIAYWERGHCTLEHSLIHAVIALVKQNDVLMRGLEVSDMKIFEAAIPDRSTDSETSNGT